jgi:hypothetical protein
MSDLTISSRNLDVLQRVTKPPVEYETAVKALAACLSLDDSKRWADKADALAAWAKIYHDGTVTRQAKALKLHAYRRMGQLAKELNPVKNSNMGREKNSGASPALEKLGLSHTEANAAMALAKIPVASFERLVDDPKSPSTYRYLINSSGTVLPGAAEWHRVQSALASARTMMRTIRPRELRLGPAHAQWCLDVIVEMNEWLDELEQFIKGSE